jgi:hypothetical protein
MNIFSDGATIWARKTIDSDIFHKKPHSWFKVWFIIVTKANHRDTKEFKRGQCFLKYSWIQDWGELTATEIDHCIRFLKSAKQIATRKATRGFIVTVLNYNLYQNLLTYKSDTKSETSSDLKAKQKRNRSDTINNNDNNDNNVLISKDITKKSYGNPDINEIISYFKNTLGLPTIDGSQRQNRVYANLCVKKFGGVDKVKLLIDSTKVNQFWATKVTSLMKLYYNGVNIISSNRNQKGGVLKL